MRKKNLPEGVIDEKMRLSFKEFCLICDVEEPFVIEMVEVGILEPEGRSISSWQFSVLQIQRFHRARRLQRDLKLNLPGVALSLELLEELKLLREHIRNLEQQLDLLTHYNKR